MRLLGLYISPRKDFSADIARETAALTHEFVVNKMREFQNGTPQARATLYLLDKDMKEFVKTQTVPTWYLRIKRWVKHVRN